MITTTSPRRLRLLAALLVAAVAQGGLSAPAAAAETDAEVSAPADLSGSYRFSGSGDQTQAIDAAIEAAIKNFDGPIREMARKRLKDANKIPSAVGLEIADDRTRVSLDQRTIRTRSGKTALYTDRSGTTSRVSHELSGDRLIERLSTAEGKRQNDYRLSDDGRTLTMTVTIRSPHLASEVRYKLTFARE
ncbi:MAG: hypothetical protein H6711_34480 [Myxococcales bacterium]|nr:hypothetical protein [Myxococcales bacterium]